MTKGSIVCPHKDNVLIQANAKLNLAALRDLRSRRHDNSCYGPGGDGDTSSYGSHRNKKKLKSTKLSYNDFNKSERAAFIPW